MFLQNLRLCNSIYVWMRLNITVCGPYDRAIESLNLPFVLISPFSPNQDLAIILSFFCMQKDLNPPLFRPKPSLIIKRRLKFHYNKLLVILEFFLHHFKFHSKHSQISWRKWIEIFLLSWINYSYSSTLSVIVATHQNRVDWPRKGGMDCREMCNTCEKEKTRV